MGPILIASDLCATESGVKSVEANDGDWNLRRPAFWGWACGVPERHFLDSALVVAPPEQNQGCKTDYNREHRNYDFMASGQSYGAMSYSYDCQKAAQTNC